MSLLAGLVIATLPACASRSRSAAPRVPDENSAASLDYRIAAARHLYIRHSALIHDGKLPPMLYAVAAIRTTIDTRGRVTRIQVTRQPAAAPEIPAWIDKQIRAAEPFPPPPAGQSTAVYNEVWLVTDRRTFQLHTLSEGQADSDGQ